jgi:hypothetical protein
MGSLKKFAKPITYLLGFTVLMVVVSKEEFYDGTRLRFWDMTAALEKWPDCYDKWGLKTFEFGQQNIDAQGECSRFNYGIFTMPLYRLMAFASQSEALWTYSLFIISVLLIFIIVERSWLVHLITLIVLISPPVTLLFESGNPDILNLLLCLIAGIALKKKWFITLAISCSVVALHKYYGAALWPLSFILAGKQKLMGRIFVLFMIIASVITLIYQIFFMGLYKFSDAGANHYGITIWDNYFRKSGIYFNEQIVQIAGIATLVILSSLLLWRKPFEVGEREPLSHSKSVALVMYLVFIFSYVTTSNVDYRLTFLGVAIIMDCSHYLSRSRFSRLLLYFAIVSLFMSYPMGYREIIPGLPLQALGDLVLHFVVAYCLARSWALFSSLRKSLKEPQVSMG